MKTLEQQTRDASAIVLGFGTIIVTIAIFLLAGCGHPVQSSAPVVVDPALAPYLISFQLDIGVSAQGITVQFANTEGLANPLGETVGECIMYSDGSRVIQIDPTYWATQDDDGKQQLMYHELTHCALNMMYHITTLQLNGCPTSIMYPYVSVCIR